MAINDDQAAAPAPMRRRQLLRAAAWGGLGALLAACGASVSRNDPAGTVAPTGARATSTPPPLLPTSPSAGGFTLNGAALPYDRHDVLILDRTSYSNFDHFNMYTEGAEFGSGYYQQAVEYLWYVNYATGETVPWLATGYLYNDDYTELTLKLRPNVTWNDGRPFTADDVAFTMTMLKQNPQLGRAAHAAIWQEIAAPDPQTVRVRFSEPQPREHQYFFCTISSGFVIQPRHIWEKVDPKQFKNNPPVTTGPWMFERADPQAGLFIWRRNERYWNQASLPSPGHLIYRAAPDGERALQEAVAGVSDSIEGINFNIYTQHASALGHVRQVTYMDPCPRGLQFNCIKPPFDKAEFRRAISMLIDRQTIAETIWVPASQPATALWADYRNLDPYVNGESNGAWGTPTYDPDRARALLRGLGYTWRDDQLLGPDGAPVAFDIVVPTFDSVGPPREGAIASAIADGLKGVGIRVGLRPLGQDTFWDALGKGDWDCISWWLCGATVDPLELFEDFVGARATPLGTYTLENQARLVDAELSRVVAQLKTTSPDAPGAMALYHEAYDHYMRACPAVPIIQTIFTSYWNTRYWEDGPDQQNLYTVPFNWWAQFLFVTLRVRPTGA